MFYSNYKRNFGKEHCVYRYVENATGKVIYVGKTNCSLRARVTAHRYEKGFQQANDFHVEYINLSNSVETDCVEKFFINKWKPVLNTKDNVSGLSSIVSTEMNEITWIPYKEYKKTYKNMVAVKKLIEEANKKVEFLKSALLYGDDGFFVCPFIDGNLLLPFPDGEKCIIQKNVSPCFGGYKYILKDGIYEQLEEYKYQIEGAIWIPVLLVCSMSDEEELVFDLINRQIEFGDKLGNFVLSGYEDDNSLYKYNFQSQYPGKEVYEIYKGVFDGIPYINEEKETLSCEINPYSYEKGIEEAEDRLAQEIISLSYELQEPVLSERNRLIMEICDPAI